METPLGLIPDYNEIPDPKKIKASDNEYCFICGITSGVILKNFIFDNCNHRYCVYCLFRWIFRNNLKEIIDQNKISIKCKCHQGKKNLSLKEIDTLIKDKSKIDEKKVANKKKFCPIHATNSEFFCKECEKYLCIHCKNEQEQEHKNHKIVSVPIYIKMYKEFIRGIPLKFKYSEDFKLQLDKSVDKFSKELAKNTHSLINDINKMIKDLNMIKNNYVEKLKIIQENGLESINLMKSFYFEYYNDLSNFEEDDDIFSLRYLSYIKYEIEDFEMNFSMGIFNKIDEIKDNVKRLISLSENPFSIKINYLDIPTTFREVTRSLGHNRPINCLLKSGDNEFISGSSDNTIKYWNLYEKELKPYELLVDKNIKNVGLLSLLKNNKLCISSFEENSIKIYEIIKAIKKDEINKEEANDYKTKLLINLEAHKEPQISILQLDDNKIVTSVGDSSINIWEPNKGKNQKDESFIIYERLKVCENGVYSLCKIIGDKFASGDADGIIKFWKKNDNDNCINEKDKESKYYCYQKFNHNAGKITCLKLINNINLCSGDDEGNIIIYKHIGNEKYEKSWSKKLIGESISCLMQMKQGNLISGSYNKENENETFLKVWEHNNKGFEIKEIIYKHYKPIRAIVELDWGNIVSAGDDGTIIIWKNGVLID